MTKNVLGRMHLVAHNWRAVCLSRVAYDNNKMNQIQILTYDLLKCILVLNDSF